MEKHQHKLRLAAIALLSALNIGFGLYAWQSSLLIGGAAGMVYATLAMGMGLCPTAKPANAGLTDCKSVVV